MIHRFDPTAQLISGDPDDVVHILLTQFKGVFAHFFNCYAIGKDAYCG